MYFFMLHFYVFPFIQALSTMDLGAPIFSAFEDKSVQPSPDQ